MGPPMRGRGRPLLCRLLLAHYLLAAQVVRRLVLRPLDDMDLAIVYLPNHLTWVARNFSLVPAYLCEQYKITYLCLRLSGSDCP